MTRIAVFELNFGASHFLDHFLTFENKSAIKKIAYKACGLWSGGLFDNYFNAIRLEPGQGQPAVIAAFGWAPGINLKDT